MHTRGDMTRAVLEGVCYSLKDCLSVLDEMNVHPDDMKICGGGGKSKLWRKMLADVYGIPVTTIESDEGPALGVAIIAMVGAGLYPTVKEACDTIVKAKETVEPDKENTARYAKFYDIYKGLYAHLKNDYKALAEL